MVRSRREVVPGARSVSTRSRSWCSLTHTKTSVRLPTPKAYACACGGSTQTPLAQRGLTSSEGNRGSCRAWGVVSLWTASATGRQKRVGGGEGRAKGRMRGGAGERRAERGVGGGGEGVSAHCRWQQRIRFIPQVDSGGRGRRKGKGRGLMSCTAAVVSP